MIYILRESANSSISLNNFNNKKNLEEIMKKDPGALRLEAAIKVIKDGLSVYPEFSDLTTGERNDIDGNIKASYEAVQEDAQTRAVATITAKYKVDGELNDLEMSEASKLAAEDIYVINAKKLADEVEAAKSAAERAEELAKERAVEKSQILTNDGAQAAKAALEDAATTVATNVRAKDEKKIHNDWLLASNDAWELWEAFALADADGKDIPGFDSWLTPETDGYGGTGASADEPNKITRAGYKAWLASLSGAGIPGGINDSAYKIWSGNEDDYKSAATSDVEDSKTKVDEKKSSLAEWAATQKKANADFEKTASEEKKKKEAGGKEYDEWVKEYTKAKAEVKNADAGYARIKRELIDAEATLKKAEKALLDHRQTAWDATLSQAKTMFKKNETAWLNSVAAHDAAKEKFDVYNEEARILNVLASEVKGTYANTKVADNIKAAAETLGWEDGATDIPTAEDLRKASAGAVVDFANIRKGLFAAANKGESIAYFEYLSPAAIDYLSEVGGYVVTKVANKLGKQRVLVNGAYRELQDSDYRVSWTVAKISYSATDYSVPALGGLK